MSIDEIKKGERINCNGVNGTVIGKRSTRNRCFVLVKMDNGFTLKLNANVLSVGLPEKTLHLNVERSSTVANAFAEA